MKIHVKNDEKWRFLSVLSKEKGRRRTKKIAEPNDLGLGFIPKSRGNSH